MTPPPVVSRRARIALLIPTLNEEEGLGATIESIPMLDLQERGYAVDLWVVDGRSTDRTVEIAHEYGAKVIVQKGRGKGRGFRQAIRNIEADFLVMLDGDATYPSEMVPQFIRELERGANVVMGNRTGRLMEEGAMSTTNKLGNWGLSLIASTLFLQRVPDVCTGMWGFDGRALEALRLNSNHFEIEAELFAESRRRRLRIEHIEIPYVCRPGESKLGGVSTGIRIGAKLARMRVRPAPDARHSARGYRGVPALVLGPSDE